jgi:hypothetical protein
VGGHRRSCCTYRSNARAGRRAHEKESPSDFCLARLSFQRNRCRLHRWFLDCLRLRGELLPDLGGDGIGIERSVLQKQEDVRLNPETQVTYWQENLRGFVAVIGVHLFETGGHTLFLHVGWQLRQQQCVAYADVAAVESSGHGIAEVGEFQAGGDVDGRLANLRRNLLDGICRLREREKPLITFARRSSTPSWT